MKTSSCKNIFVRKVVKTQITFFSIPTINLYFLPNQKSNGKGISKYKSETQVKKKKGFISGSTCAHSGMACWLS